MKGLVFVSVACFVVGLVYGSAIPVWEFLKREEKTSFLYSVFAGDAEKLCTSIHSSDCLKGTLKYGLDKLKELSDEDLDGLDPYQRDGNNLIWRSLMKGHKYEGETPVPQTTTTAKPNSYDDESFGDLDFGSEGSASAKIDNVYRVPPPKGFVGKYEPQFNSPQDYLGGPVMYFVYPDGRPVDDKPKVPIDEDLRQYQWSKIKLPNF